MRTQITLSLLLTLSLAALTGCVHQKMVIRSNPEGARVFWDGEDKGVTPVEFPFDWYGGHKVVLEKEGYQRTSKIENVKCPPHLWIPFDLVMAAVPAPIKDTHVLEYELAPAGAEISEATPEAAIETAPESTESPEAGHAQ